MAKSKAALSPEDAERMAKARLVMQGFDQERKYGPFPSNSGGDPYTVIHHGDGHLSCNCRGWINRGGGRPDQESRTCAHQIKVMAELSAMGAKFEIRKIGEPRNKDGLQDAYTFVIEKASRF